MSQPRSDAAGGEPPHPPPPDPPLTLPDDADAALGGPVPLTDDAPTVISRHPPRPGSTEEVLGTSVRGRRLAHFELIAPIGVGGMAAVLRAQDLQLERPVALKILPPEMAADAENVRRFHQEARSAAKLDHENIARVFFCGEDQRLHFIAFEFVEGDNLRTVLERRGRLPVGEALHYMLQVAAGLAHAAQRGVVHRDIKPSNIIITPTGRAKLVDMGLARSLGPQPDLGLTQSGVTLGTFDYISPEQALEPRDADVRSDIYSLGCTFYHMLTGRPSVPEGTAAKKLHHHQHVKPVDPRQYVPELPLEVALVLDRMMAKQPKDRYQSPEQLVQHLLQAARKLGQTPEVPEGVLSVEATLPNARAGRPLLLAALAVAAVVGLILALDQASPPSRAPDPTAVAPPGGGGRAARPGHERPHPDNPDPPPVKPAATGAAARVYQAPEEPTVKHLVDWVEENQDAAARLELYLAGDLDLSAPGQGAAGGLVVRARHVTIKAQDPSQPPTLRFSYDAGAARGRRVALTVRARESVVEGVRFVVDARESPGTEMVGLLLADGHKHQVERCEFLQVRPSFKKDARLASVVAEADRSRPELTLRGCCFLGFGRLTPGEAGEGPTLSGAEPGGQDAVVRKGAVRVTAVDCAFGPHLAAFRLLEGGDDAGTLTMRHCSVLGARRSAVFELGAGASAAVDASSCLFARVDEASAGPAAEGDNAVLLRQGDAGGALAYTGQGNRYYNLDGYWVVGDAWQEAGWRDFRRKVREAKDDDSRVLLSRPWKFDPEQQLELLEKGRPAQAFQVNDRVAALRVSGRAGEKLVGVGRLLDKPLAPGLLPEPDKTEAGRRCLVVEVAEKDGGGGSLNGVYPSLNDAASAAQPGDTILLRWNGEKTVEPIALGKRGMSDLTVRPARGFRPALTLGNDTEKDSALFRVHDGKLLLEGLEFRLQPDEEYTSQALVALVGDGDCALKGCVVTLDKGSRNTPLALATLAEAGKVMRLVGMSPTRKPAQGPRLALEGCFVRGQGDLLSGRGGRPCELDVQDTLVALAGSLLSAEVEDDAPAAPAKQAVELKLARVTTYLGGHLIRLAVGGKDLKGLLPVRCTPVECLFLPGPGAKTLVHLAGPEAEEADLKDKLRWDAGENANAYGEFSALLDQQTPGGEGPAPMDAEKWKTFTSEKEPQFGVKLKGGPSGEPFTGLEPKHFKQPEGSDRGVDAGKLPAPRRKP